MEFSWEWIVANAHGIEAVCIVLSATAAFLVIWHNGVISRRESTINMIHASFFSEERESYKAFAEVILKSEANGIDLAHYASLEQALSPENAVILAQLNNYELVALGCKKRVIDERFYRRWFYSQLTRDFYKLRGFIIALRLRLGNQAIFCEFETLARRWTRKKHPVRFPPKRRVFWLVLTGQWELAFLAISARRIEADTDREKRILTKREQPPARPPARQPGNPARAKRLPKRP